MSGYYDTMQVCKKWGHKVTAYYNSHPNHKQAFCEKCGSSTIFKCEFCNEKIRGYYHVVGVVSGDDSEVPFNCHKCGASYPWRNKLFMKSIFLKAISPLKYVLEILASFFKK